MKHTSHHFTFKKHYLERHGGDPSHVISPSDLLPLDATTVDVSEFELRRSSLMYSTQICTTPTFRRCISSTPVSRRSSVSSPDPVKSECSSGYSSTCNSVCNNSPPSTNTALQPRRLSVETIKMRHRTSVGNFLNSTPALQPPSKRPTSAPVKVTRYPNYLQSSQHITNRLNGISELSFSSNNLAKPQNRSEFIYNGSKTIR